MEPQSSSTQLEDQLQSPAVQDQELPSGPAPELTPDTSERTKVVISYADRMVKGYISPPAPDEGAETRPRPGVIRVRRLDGVLEEITLTQTQGVYFVKEFEEDSSHHNLLFYNLPPTELLWARLVFKNGEVIEGMIDNGPQLVLEPGFLMTPTDPTGNNRFIFVLKNQIQDFKVLGLRHRSKKSRAPAG